MAVEMYPSLGQETEQGIAESRNTGERPSQKTPWCKGRLKELMRRVDTIRAGKKK